MSSFLQSAEWQEIQERMGRPTARIGAALVIRHDLPLGLHYLYTPRPGALTHAFFKDVTVHARERGALFLKIDPVEPLPVSPGLITGESREAPATIRIDCRASASTLLSGMHPKTRYNLRLAERHGVTVRRASQPTVADIDCFLKLLDAAAGRDGFSPHPNRHYRILLEVASGEFMNELFFAEHRGLPVAAAVVNFYLPDKTATYIHGGSDYHARSLMAPYLLHWRITEVIRERGFHLYDLGGIDPRRWPGLTRFKEGFGGVRHVFPPAADYVLRPRFYRIWRWQRRLRRSLAL